MRNPFLWLIHGFKSPVDPIYRVKYVNDGVWKLSGWYLQARGGKYGHYWSNVFSNAFSTEDEAVFQMAVAKGEVESPVVVAADFREYTSSEIADLDYKGKALRAEEVYHIMMTERNRMAGLPAPQPTESLRFQSLELAYSHARKRAIQISALRAEIFILSKQSIPYDLEAELNTVMSMVERDAMSIKLF